MERSTNWVCATLCSILFVFTELIAFSRAYAFESSCPASISTGQPACGESSDIGSNAPSIETTVHVGNPVDVASGNKYQSDVDVRLADSILSLVRHYNSAQSNVNIGLGNGWRHTYSVMLSQYGDNQLQIVQSDGRRMTFVGSNSVFHAVNEADGFISVLPNGRHVWNLPDGRRLLFVGSFLAKISSGNEELVLHYQNTRLVSVTDSAGRSIEFEYAPGNIGLPSYTPGDESVPAGHLRAIVLPDTTRVEYKYDHQHNLISVKYPRGTIRSVAKYYRYEDDLNRALLTERANALDVPVARWTYDNHERVSSYRSGWNIRADGSERGLPDLKFEYSEGASPSVGRTTVYHQGGGVRVYEWRVGDDNGVLEVGALDAESHKEFNNRNIDSLGSETSNALADSSHQGDMLTILTVDELGYPNMVEYFHSKSSTSYEFQALYSQIGVLVEVYKLKVNRTRPDTDSVFGHGDDVNAFGGLQSETEIAIESTIELASLQNSVITFLESSKVKLLRGSIIAYRDLDTSWGEAIRSLDYYVGGSRVKSGGGPSPACASPLVDCAQLLRLQDYAEVAGCAYMSTACYTRFREVNLNSMGIDRSLLAEGSYRAEIFYDSVNDEYIVTFAGTDPSSPGDWYSNIQQELGRNAFQYEKAVRLARFLSQQHPTLSFTYTGHSLGGGLATAAAGATRSQAVVFNPAGLTRETADRLGVDYFHVQQHTNVFSVDGELLNGAQAGSSFMQEPPGVISNLPRPSFDWVQSNVDAAPILTYGVRLGLALHGMEAVTQSIAETVVRQQCSP